MSNPWLKKNPFMSMWLSAANRMVGSLRSQVTPQAKRAVNAAVAEAAKENVKLWSAALRASPAQSKPKRKR